MDVRFNAADLVDVYPLLVDQSLFDVSMRQRFKRWRQKRQAVFGVPNEMQIDFTVVIVCHRTFLNTHAGGP